MKKWVKRFVPIGIVIAVITSFVFTGIASQKAPSIPSTAEKALVARVIDGDTIQLDDGRKVRLIGVDTPETVHPQKEVEYYGKEASDFTKAVLLERIVNIGGTYRLVKYSPYRPASLPTTASSLFSDQDIRHDCRQL